MNQLNGLQNLFSSNFYIDGQYAMSFAPTLLQLVTGNIELEEKPIDKLISNSLSESNSQDSEKSIVVLSIKQPIIKYTDAWYGWLGSKTFISILKNLESRSDVLGVVLDIDSGGGQVYGTPEFYDFIRNFSKPIVAYTDGYMCSAAYYIGNGTNYIVANKRADAIGSIGAYSSFLDFTGMFEKWGAKDHTFYATKSTEKNSEVREILEKSNYEPYIKNILDPMVETFHNDMKATRPGLNEAVFKGGTWGAEKSLELGLIDEIGTIETAILKVVELSNSDNLNSNTDMSKENSFPKLAAVLGVEGIEAKKANIFSANETVSLTAEQLASIEAALADPGDSQKLADLQTELSTEKADKKKAEDKATAIDTAVNSAIEKAGLTAEKKSTTAENIDFLAEKVIEYGANDGDKPTNVTSKGDKVVDADAESTEIYDSMVN